ncbi:MAG: hypothetical protein HFH87_14430, partial [Lachnospiraceae bacterium]|nr:hypothetical protein [Lachnospiraceae bacterium]
MQTRAAKKNNTEGETSSEKYYRQKPAAGGEKAEQVTTEQEKANLAKAEQTAKKQLAEMNLLDNFLFGSVVTYPEIGEKFVGYLLKTILGRKVKHLSVTAQKVFYGADSDLHGARLDVYLEPEIE